MATNPTTTTYIGADGVTRTVFEIPLQPEAQIFSISLSGTTYNFELQWCGPANSWTLYILDSLDNPLVDGLELVTGADLLDQFAYVGIGGSLVVQSDFDPTQVPDYASLGSTGHLFFVTPAL